VRGEIAGHDVKVLELAALKGVFTDVVEEAVTYVNAPLLAGDRGVDVRLTTSPDSPDYRNLVTVRGTLADGRVHSVSGTLTGPRLTEKIVAVDGFDLEIVPTDHMAFFRYEDRPGVVGVVGRILGNEAINIAGMQVSRDTRGGHALVALTVDSAVPHAVLDEIVAAVGAESGRTVDLV
jgi:D-3-phosphoglycerate dehydrogenase / 2-oxoglutarate reductase